MILLDQQAPGRDEAIDLVGQLLVGGGYVQPAYVASMKARELTMSTYVGNGVAIPHGTFEDKTLILSTGVAGVPVSPRPNRGGLKTGHPGGRGAGVPGGAHRRLCPPAPAQGREW